MRRILTVSAVVCVVLVASPAQADLLFFSPAGVASEDYDGPTHPVPVGSNSFRMTFHSDAPNKSIVDPVLLILGIPTGIDAPTLTLLDDDGFLEVSIVRGGPSVYGGIWDADGFGGTFTAAGNSAMA